MRSSSGISSHFSAVVGSSPWRALCTVSSQTVVKTTPLCQQRHREAQRRYSIRMSQRNHSQAFFSPGRHHHGNINRGWTEAIWRRGYSSSKKHAEDIPLKPSTLSSQASTPPSSTTLHSSSSETEETAVNPEGPTASSTDHALQQSWSNYPPFINRMLERISRISHRLNVYTGTDYSGITALRALISQQERAVASAYAAAEEAKQAHGEAVGAQSARQKEVVQLLERKNSWSAGDLERYMALIRREHVEEQAVTATSDGLTAAERALEAARVDLERIERRQYHEEQIWSDTIRRNSTWVTIGLMGFNVALLLLSLVVFEPWRRRRIVREVRDALNANDVVVSSSFPLPSSSDTPVSESASALPLATSNEAAITIAASAPELDADLTSIEREIDASTAPTNATLEQLLQHTSEEDASHTRTLSDRIAHAREYLFSDATLVAMTRRDITVTVLQSAAVGMGLACIVCFKIFAPSSSPPS